MKRASLLIRCVTGVPYYVQEYPSNVLRLDYDLANFRSQFLFDVELEVRIGRARAVEGQSGVFIEQRVDVGGPLLARLAAHHQHVLNDAIGAVAVR